ncbi:hypothetical protein Tco_0705365 [Tanacetum coccineum]|uniref:Uncharacterized protein n=1 Tax=Tanacetum coccineum TaxID=301880 RepID=A0ABQ4Y4F1_9ASTR
MGAVNILANGGLKEVFTTASPPVPHVSLFLPTVVATASEKDSTTAEYAQAEDVLSLEDKIELITELTKYQKDLAQIKKYQAQQSKLASKIDRMKFYTSVLRSHAGWKTKDFKGVTFEQIEETFIPVWESIQDFMPMDSKLKSERFKRPGTLLEKERAKRLKTVMFEPVATDGLWQFEAPIKSWRLYKSCRVTLLDNGIRIFPTIVVSLPLPRFPLLEDFPLLIEDKDYSESKMRLLVLNWESLDPSLGTTSTGSPSSTTVDQDAPSPSNSQTTPETQPPLIPNDVKDNHDVEVEHMGTDPYLVVLNPEVEPKTYKDDLTQSCWIEEMQEELNEFGLLEV